MVRVVARHAHFSLPLILLVASIAAAQTPTAGRLTGTVKDPSGAIVPGAEILAKNAQTGSEFRATTNEVGVWVMPSVPSGSYTVTVSAQGFKTSTFEAIKVDQGGTEPVDSTLQMKDFRDTVLVTASKFEEEVVNAPATATVISEQTIRNSPSQNVAELLRVVPGMNVARISARDFSVTGRAANGVVSGSSLAVIDGRTIYLDYIGYVDWELVPTSLDEVTQVEVIRGPASAVWGAYALNGVVNIVTKPPREMRGTTLAFGMGTFDRSGGGAESDRGSLYYLSAAHAQALNDRWAFKITGSAYTQDAFARPQGTIPNAYHTPYPPFPNEGTTQPKIDARVDYDFPDGQQHFSLSGGFAGSNGIAHSGLGPITCPTCDLAYGQMNYVRGALRITGFVNTLKAEMQSLVMVSPGGQLLQLQAHNQTYDVELGNSHTLQAKHLIRAEHLLSYGGNFRHNQINASFQPQARGRNERGAYFQDEILLSEHFRWVVGARVDKFDFLKGAVFSPRTTFMVKPVPGQTVRMSYNRAFVAPCAQNNYMQIAMMSPLDLGLLDPQLAGNVYSFPVSLEGNRDLKEQSLHAYEIGYTAMVAKGRANLGAAFYINDGKGAFYIPPIASYTSQDPPPGWPLPPFVLDALIAANAFGPGIGLPSMFKYQNLGKVRNKGLELSAEARFHRYVSGFANYSWQARPESKDYDVSLWNLPPTHRFNGGLDFDYKRYQANVSVGYVGSAYWTDVLSAPYNGPTKAYTVVNASAGVRWGGGTKYLAMLKISNLANTPIQNHVFGDILKRQIAGELRVRF
ncbi:MAG: TonB-dependent receptor [Acidobacteriia bacterium]|nr:TonB-dependent receptor [Terriglobia bacterium]